MPARGSGVLETHLAAVVGDAPVAACGARKLGTAGRLGIGRLGRAEEAPFEVGGQ